MLVEIALLTGAGYWYQQRQQKNNLAQLLTHDELPTRQASSMSMRPFSVRQLLNDIKGAMEANGRQQLQVDIDPRILESIEKERLKANRRMGLAIVAALLALLGGIYPVFSIFGALGVLYLSRRMFVRTWKDFKVKHYLSANLVGLAMTMGMLASGQLVLAAFAGVMGSFFAKIIDKVEGGAQRQLINTFVEHPQSMIIESS